MIKCRTNLLNPDSLVLINQTHIFREFNLNFGKRQATDEQWIFQILITGRHNI